MNWGYKGQREIEVDEQDITGEYVNFEPRN